MVNDNQHTYLSLLVRRTCVSRRERNCEYRRNPRETYKKVLCNQLFDTGLCPEKLNIQSSQEIHFSPSVLDLRNRRKINRQY